MKKPAMLVSLRVGKLQVEGTIRVNVMMQVNAVYIL